MSCFCCSTTVQIDERQASMDAAAEGFGSHHGPNSGSTRTNASLKIARAKALLPNCQIFRYSNARLAAKFGSSSRWKDEICPICIETYNHGDYLAVCPCKHGYHLICLEDWLRVKSDCPLCKRPVRNELNEQSPLLFAVV